MNDLTRNKYLLCVCVLLVPLTIFSFLGCTETQSSNTSSPRPFSYTSLPYKAIEIVDALELPISNGTATFSENGCRISCADNIGRIQILTIFPDNSYNILQYSQGESRLLPLFFSQKGEYLIITSVETKKVSVIDMHGNIKMELQSFTGDNMATCGYYDENSNIIVLGRLPNILAIYNASNGMTRKYIPLNGTPYKVWQGTKGNHLVIGTNKGIIVWDKINDKIAWETKSDDGVFDINEEFGILVNINGKGKITFRSIQAEARIGEILTGFEGATSIAMSSDLCYVAIANSLGKIEIYDLVSNGKYLDLNNPWPPHVIYLKLDDGPMLLSGNENGILTRWCLSPKNWEQSYMGLDKNECETLWNDLGSKNTNIANYALWKYYVNGKYVKDFISQIKYGHESQPTFKWQSASERERRTIRIRALHRWWQREHLTFPPRHVRKPSADKKRPALKTPPSKPPSESQ